jgi:hypothetical protein
LLTYLQTNDSIGQEGFVMSKLILIFSFLLLSGCYQLSELPGVGGENEESGTFLICTKEDVSGPFISFGTIDENFRSFFKSSVVSNDGSPLPLTLDYDSNPAYDTRVDYAKLLKDKERPESKALRNSILGHLKNLELDTLTKEQQISILLNAYNFLAVDIVLQNSCEGLISSIADLGGKDSFKAFSDGESFGYFIGAEKLSLDNIEKEKIAELTNFEDARIHFAVICASAGCPVLLHLPFDKTNLEKQLSFITRAGLRLPRMLNSNGGTSFLSQIFDWYLDDFVADIARDIEFDSEEEFIEEFIKRFTADGTEFNRDNIDYVNYDWSLNKP